MKAKLIHEMSADELTAQLAKLKATLYQLRFDHVIGQLSNPKQLTACKKDIARVMTVQRERQLKSAAPAASASAKKA